MYSIKKAFGFGFLVWLIPFVSAFAFYTPEGHVRISQDLFKSIMIVVSVAVGSFLLVRYFSRVLSHFVREGIVVGALWLVLNIVLDILVLLPMSHLSFGDYLSQIGIRYVSMPILSIAFGSLAQMREKR